MKKLFWLTILLFSLFTGYCQEATWNNQGGVGAHGYDLVSYFSGETPVKGMERWASRYEGLTFYFASPANKEAFEKTPEMYLPQYGGWCAYAMGLDGSRVDVDPETYKVHQGKLYLFYHSLLNNTLKKWNAKETELLPQADRNWNSQ